MRNIRSFLILAGLLIGLAPAEAKTIQITIENLSFSPQNIEANVGDVIEWNNKDPMQHSATVKGGWDILLPAKKVTKQVLDSAQTVNYYCRFHPDMTGQLTVKP
ncbi:cupredoxin domain-containing protein [Falsochrobactrum sp. TDYN1]|uniref:Cupredoxin domain-containing protein n=1 Tax=Falsochrobactrum tianjinense TaxID=2706015 RepID=A0A949UTS0_9HYPH|nr:cupredoxin domain-containing protein [Falsochrobactrum sp. TDYN1]MBV2144105.1 cupredoxin domain-containing protein [Falsochrobactrum sp. TDYN1]